jgi:hypothetical protein
MRCYTVPIEWTTQSGRKRKSLPAKGLTSFFEKVFHLRLARPRLAELIVH